jgi:hypothetical protein
MSTPASAAIRLAFGDAPARFARRRCTGDGVFAAPLAAGARGGADGCAADASPATASASSVGVAAGWEVGAPSASPGARIRAITCPTGTSSPSPADTAESTPSAGASISTVTLSVSISSSASPRRTSDPSAAIQRRIRPVSWANPNAGITTSLATGATLPSRSRRTATARRRRPPRASVP